MLHIKRGILFCNQIHRDLYMRNRDNEKVHEKDIRLCEHLPSDPDWGKYWRVRITAGD